MSGLPDKYTRRLRVVGLRAEGIYIKQTTSAHGIHEPCMGKH